MKITVGEAEELATDLLVAAGHPRTNAIAIAKSLATAELWGLGSHGLLRLPIYLDRLEAGGYDARAELELVDDRGAMLVFDGHGGLGHWQLTRAVQLAVPRAQQFGIAAVAIGDSGHCGALGVYAAEAAEAGMTALVFSNGPAALAPWGGSERLLSSSPIAAAFPAQPRPLVVDLALSTVARGRIAEHAARGEPLPDGWALDPDGRPTNDPAAGLAGFLAPLGGAKGFALALMVEALTAGLVGPLLSRDVPDMFDTSARARPQRLAHLLLVIDPRRTDVAGDPDASTLRLAELVAACTEAGGRAPGSHRVPPGRIEPGALIEVDDELVRGLRRRAALVAPGDGAGST